jgi:prephenate dehydrogenase
MCEANVDELLPALERTLRLLNHARDALAAKSPLTELVEAGHAARVRYDSFSRPEIVTTVVGEDKWREELAAAGRAGGVIRSALPVLGSRG